MKKNIIITSISFLIIITLIALFSIKTEGKVYESKLVNDKSHTLSILLETGADTGIYEESENSTWPAAGYVLNEQKSGCRYGSTLTWDDANNKVIVKGNSKDFCYAYFDALSYCEMHPYDLSCVDSIIGLTNVYHHDANLTNGAGDGSYRYSGPNPNNYVCFGSDASTCPDANLYRIIGLIPVTVVTGTNPLTTENQVLYKLIKHNFITSAELGVTSDKNVDKNASYAGPSGNQPSGNVPGFVWTNPDSLDANNYNYSTNQYNTWTQSTLNTTYLNGSFLTNIGSTWANKIATVVWKVGGNAQAWIQYADPLTEVYYYEIANSGVRPSDFTDTWNAPRDGNTTYNAKVGLMYITDYVYGTTSTYWDYYPQGFTGAAANNDWLYKGVFEWSITRVADKTDTVLGQSDTGHVIGIQIHTWRCGVRPVFYLKQSAVVDVTNHAGTLADPFRVS